MPVLSSAVGILMAVVTMFAIICNSLIFIVICWNHSIKRPLNLFLFNLAIADIGEACTCIPYAVGEVLFREKGLTSTFCKINSFTVTLFTAASVLGIVVLCLYQYLMITGPLDSEISGLQSVVFLLMAWMTAIGLAIGPIFNGGKYEFSSSIFGCIFANVDDIQRVTYNTLIMTTLYALPLFLLLFCYISIVIYTGDTNTRTAKGCVVASVANNNGCLETGQTRINTAVLLVFLSFIAFRTPFFVSILLSTFKLVGPTWLKIIDQIAFWAIYFQAASDPFVYAFQHGEYTSTLRIIATTLKSRLFELCCCCHAVEEGQTRLPMKPSLERIEEE